MSARTAAPVLRAYSYPGLDKAAFLAELAEHAAADRVIQGSYETYDKGEFRGCAVGCSLHSVKRHLGLGSMSLSNHALFETYLGIPRLLARLEDRIFEGLPVAEARLWPQRFANAVQPGADLSGVWNQFARWLLREIALPAAKTEKTRAAIIAVAEGYETNWGTLTPRKARRQAAAAADDAAYAAAYAADAAYAAAYAADAAYADDAAYAAYAAYAAAYAAYAAYAAAYAADAAAYAADAADAAADAAARRSARETARTSARQSAYSTMAGKLCELISAAPISKFGEYP